MDVSNRFLRVAPARTARPGNAFIPLQTDAGSLCICTATGPQHWVVVFDPDGPVRLQSLEDFEGEQVRLVPQGLSVEPADKTGFGEPFEGLSQPGLLTVTDEGEPLILTKRPSGSGYMWWSLVSGEQVDNVGDVALRYAKWRVKWTNPDDEDEGFDVVTLQA